MACYMPVKAFRVPGTPALFWSQSKAGKAGLPLDVPCGRCVGCRGAHAGCWGVRSVQEAKLHAPGTSHALTLTYDDDHLPFDGSLSRLDLKLFHRRLRYELGSSASKQLSCGEYGGQFGRPHYHPCIFGYEIPDLRPWGRSGDLPTFVSDRVSAIWGKGHVLIMPLTLGTAAYPAKYTVKGGEADFTRRPHYRPHPLTGELHLVQPEFLSMSRGHSGGIGAGWFDRFGGDAFPSDFVIVEGSRKKVPRYYMELLKARTLAGEFELLPMHDAVKAERKQAARDHAADNTPERLAVRHEIALRARRGRSFDGVGA